MVSTAQKVDTTWVNDLDLLDTKTVGALQRIRNLSNQLTGDWSGMMGTNVQGEDFGSFRFQLAYMAYALGVAHVNRLPAAPGVFQAPFKGLIEKILLADCWAYWAHVSTGNGFINKAMGVQPKRWDPVKEENIMYSAYVQSMALMYHYLFRDDRYAQPGALTFELKTLFWHDGGFRFEYDEKTLNEGIYWQMSEQGFLGVACEPGCIFQVCNQPNLIGFRLHDLIYGSDFSTPASEGYKRAWEEFGMSDETGEFPSLYLTFAKQAMSIPSTNLNFWLMALMNSWYPEMVEKHYPTFRDRVIKPGPNESLWIEPAPFVGAEEGDPMPATHMGWAACAAAEMGDENTLNGLLKYADNYLNSAWEDGAFFYRRRDTNFDKDGNYICMDPHSGNALFSYARLNSKGGLRKLYEGALDDDHFNAPALIDLAIYTRVTRAVYVSERSALVISLADEIDTKRSTLSFRSPQDKGLPNYIRDGELQSEGITKTADGFSLELDHKNATDLVFEW